MNKKNEQLPGIIKMVISVEIIAFVLFMIYFIFQDRGIHEMISQREEMQYTYGELQKVYREYQDSLDKNERMKQSLIQKREDQKRRIPDGLQVIYGSWIITPYYSGGEVVKEEKDQWEMTITSDSVRIGEHEIGKPVFCMSVRNKWNLIYLTLERYGISREKAKDLIPEGYYVEIKLGQSECEENILLSEEEELMWKTKYYLVDEDTMFGVSSEEKDTVYYLHRSK